MRRISSRKAAAASAAAPQAACPTSPHAHAATIRNRNLSPPAARTNHRLPLFVTRPRPSLPQTQERERAKTRSLSKTIGCPMIDKDPQMIR